MKELVQQFPQQLREALSIAQSYQFQAAPATFTNVVLTGLGGSGIGGSIAQGYTLGSLKIPFIVNKDYTLPAFVSKDSLVIVSSYSGNTEETVAALQQAIKVKATVICITSGGKVAEIAAKKKIDCIMLPGGMPPRACLGYSLVQVLRTLSHFKLISTKYIQEVKATTELLETESKNIQKKAAIIAQKLNGTTPIIYSSADFEGVAVRFRQQINENSKMLCWHHAIPEMNHNELVGWRDKDDSRAVVILRNENDYERVQLRMDINKSVFKKYTKNIHELMSKGNSYLERAFYLIHLTDWVSIYLAELHGVDATEVKVIDHLKGELAKA